ncbi:MAG: HEAT repeat domain-containing protein [Cyclobacteriaceae bacterium]|nr:HEAT repeat domain-containing protein [Cyclobacteriaceae bacterium]
MAIDITTYLEQLSGKLNESAYKASDSLGRIGSEPVVKAMIELLNHSYPESRIMAAKTLGLVKNNNEALVPLLEAIKNKENSSIAGDLMIALEGFDVSENYVELFKLYLFGSYKVSMVAKDLLDYKEFSITPRVIKKAQKHWDHYSNNIKQDEVYVLRLIEVEEMLSDLKAYLD